MKAIGDACRSTVWVFLEGDMAIDGIFLWLDEDGQKISESCTASPYTEITFEAKVGGEVEGIKLTADFPQGQTTIPISWGSTRDVPIMWPKQDSVVRSIRLKETPPNTHSLKRPPVETLERAQNLDDKEYLVRADSAGFLESSYNKLPTSEAQNILLIGCSVAEGTFTEEGLRYPALAENILREHGYPVNLYNAARTSGNLLSAFNVLISKLSPYGWFGRRVILAVSLNDFNASGFEWSYWASHEHSGQLLPPREGRKTRPRSFKESTQLLDLFLHACKVFGYELLVSIPSENQVDFDHHPLPEKAFGTRERYEKHLDDVRHFRSTLVEWAHRTATPFLDQYESTQGKNVYFYDNQHLSDEGHRVVGEAMANKLLELNWHAKL